MFYKKRSHQRYSVKKAILKNFAKYTGKQLCWGLFFLVNIAKVFKSTYFEEGLKRLLLEKKNSLKWKQYYQSFKVSWLAAKSLHNLKN